LLLRFWLFVETIEVQVIIHLFLGLLQDLFSYGLTERIGIFLLLLIIIEFVF
jgi:hypothetical protein